VRFRTYVLTSLDRVQSNVATSALALLREPQSTPIEPIPTTLLNAVDLLPTDTLLVLDDYHLIEARYEFRFRPEEATTFLTKIMDFPLTQAQVEQLVARTEKELIPGYRVRRWVVERTHSWLNRSRRILVRLSRRKVRITWPFSISHALN
jgi:hypothetical protein